jgi:hypothetical protein
MARRGDGLSEQAGTAMTSQNSTAFATTQLDRLMGFFPRVEAKASFILALNFAMLGVLALNFPIRAIASPRGCFGIVAALLLILSLSQLYVVFFPHLKPGDKPSLVFFGDIADMGWRGYHREVASLTDDTLLEDLTCQIWRNSEILKIKFDKTRAAFVFTLVALPFWLLLLSAVALRSGKFVLSH